MITQAQIVVLIIGMYAIGGILLIFPIARYLESREWNRGFCRKHGSEWKNFDTDSQGGRGYKCADGCHTWISYNVDKSIWSYK